MYPRYDLLHLRRIVGGAGGVGVGGVGVGVDVGGVGGVGGEVALHLRRRNI